MFVYATEDVTEVIARRSVQLARSWTAHRGWAGTRYLHPTWSRGWAGIKTSRRYLIYQNRGFEPFLMTSLEGRVVPIGRRLVRAVGVGKPGFVNIPIIRANVWGKNQESTQKVWRDQKWRHPGLKPKRFLEDSIEQAIRENQGLIQRSAMRQVSRWIAHGLPRELEA